MPQDTPTAIKAIEVPPRAKTSFYPEPFASQMQGRQKRQLGEYFGLKNFGVNLTRLAAHSVSSIRHSHTKQDEFVYIVEGCPTLYTDEGQLQLSPCAWALEPERGTPTPSEMRPQKTCCTLKLVIERQETR
jgi:uncharacterized cupin superfamily protein